MLVANAALPGAAELTDLTQDQIDGMLEVNLRAPIALARALVPPWSRAAAAIWCSSRR